MDINTAYKENLEFMDKESLAIIGKFELPKEAAILKIA